MQKLTLRAFLATLLLLLLALPAQAQQEMTLTVQPDSKIWAEGTSNKSDWTVQAEAFDGTVTMMDAMEGDMPDIKAVHLTVQAAEMKSGKSSIMDRLMHKTLMVQQHPEIVYELTEVAPAPDAGSQGPGLITLRTTGNLTIGGVTRPVEVLVQAEHLGGKKMQFTGSHTMMMSDFEMTPPTAMYGALRTRDECTFHIDLIVAP